MAALRVQRWLSGRSVKVTVTDAPSEGFGWILKVQTGVSE